MTCHMAGRLISVGVAASLAVALTPCTSDDHPAQNAMTNTSRPSAGPQPDAMTPLPQVVVDSFPRAQPVTMLPVAPQGAVSLPWGFVKADQSDVSVLYIAGEPDCYEFKGFTVIEDPEGVRVGVWASPTGDKACGGSVEQGATTLHLKQPLGQRRLLHEPVDPAFSANYFAP